MNNITYIRILTGVGIILIVSIIILDILDILDILGNNTVKIKSNFADITVPNRIVDGIDMDTVYEKNRTLLYGSLFLDKLNEQIKEMTDPKIQYDDKRIDIIKYSDVLL